ncbi:MAG: response regulator transcription factor [Salinivirgaceae bacterium]
MKTESPKACILYVEDDSALSFVTRDNLEEMGYRVVHFDDGKAALSNFTAQHFDLCLLDVMLPKMDGFELARRIREINNSIPILFLSAKTGIDDRIEGLKLGGDDYLTKPFSMDELRLKIEVFIRRNKVSDSTKEGMHQLKTGNYLLDVPNQLLSCNEISIKLTLKETRLIALLFTRQNQLISRQEILMQIWGDDSYFNGRSLDVFISRIRKYLKHDPQLEIESIRSIGFRLIQHAKKENQHE